MLLSCAPGRAAHITTTCSCFAKRPSDTARTLPHTSLPPLTPAFTPSADADPVEQLFSILVAVFGLAAFALVLALVEQVVLEANNRNVKRGSRVYETGHVSRRRVDVECFPSLGRRTRLRGRPGSRGNGCTCRGGSGPWARLLSWPLALVVVEC